KLTPTEINSYTCVKYNKKEKSITFQWSSDFNTANEPVVEKCILVKQNKIKRIKQPQDPYVWHHKWQWVADNYDEFDVEKSKTRSKQWKPYVNKEEKCKIGKLSFWNIIKSRFENREK
ncbi:MAG: hypothetical protein ACOCUH_03725, partial [Bacteriovoracia bacterium]